MHVVRVDESASGIGQSDRGVHCDGDSSLIRADRERPNKPSARLRAARRGDPCRDGEGLRSEPRVRVRAIHEVPVGSFRVSVLKVPIGIEVQVRVAPNCVLRRLDRIVPREARHACSCAEGFEAECRVTVREHPQHFALNCRVRKVVAPEISRQLCHVGGQPSSGRNVMLYAVGPRLRLARVTQVSRSLRPDREHSSTAVALLGSNVDGVTSLDRGHRRRLGDRQQQRHERDDSPREPPAHRSRFSLHTLCHCRPPPSRYSSSSMAHVDFQEIIRQRSITKEPAANDPRAGVILVECPFEQQRKNAPLRSYAAEVTGNRNCAVVVRLDRGGGSRRLSSSRPPDARITVSSSPSLTGNSEAVI